MHKRSGFRFGSERKTHLQSKRWWQVQIEHVEGFWKAKPFVLKPSQGIDNLQPLLCMELLCTTKWWVTGLFQGASRDQCSFTYVADAVTEHLFRVRGWGLASWPRGARLQLLGMRLSQRVGLKTKSGGLWDARCGRERHGV